MNLKSSFNPESLMITITVESGLIDKYYANLRGLLLKCKSLPGLEVKQGNDNVNSVEISFPIPSRSGTREVDENRVAITLNMNDLTEIRDTVNLFINVAINKELRKVEFFPLDGYSFSKMSEEIKETVKNHRNILFIKDYKEFTDMENNREYKFTQYEVEYGTPEYFDCVLMIWKKQKSLLKKLYSDKLVFTNWA